MEMRVDTAITMGHTSWEVVDFSIIFQMHPCFAEFNLTDEASVGIELSGKRSRGDRKRDAYHSTLLMILYMEIAKQGCDDVDGEDIFSPN